MRQEGFYYIPKIMLRFTREEVTELMWLSTHHYDQHCISVSRPGGFLYGISNCFWNEGKEPEFAHELSFSDVDTLAKITEIPLPPPKMVWSDLHLPLVQLLGKLNAEYNRLNHPENEEKS